MRRNTAVALSGAPVTVHVNRMGTLTRGLGYRIVPTSTADMRSLRGMFGASVSILRNRVSFILRSVNVSPGMHGGHACSSLSCKVLRGALSVSTISFRGVVRTTGGLGTVTSCNSVLTLDCITTRHAFCNCGSVTSTGTLLRSVTHDFNCVCKHRRDIHIGAVSRSPAFAATNSNIGKVSGLFSFSGHVSPLKGTATSRYTSCYVMVFSSLAHGIAVRGLCRSNNFSDMNVDLHTVTACRGKLSRCGSRRKGVVCKWRTCWIVGVVGLEGPLLLVVLYMFTMTYQVNAKRGTLLRGRRGKVSVIHCSGLRGRCMHSGDFSTLRGVGVRCHRPAGVLVRRILKLKRIGSSAVSLQLQAFCSSAALLQLVTSMRAHFPSLKRIRGKLAGNFGELGGRIPSVGVPGICSRVSTFGRSMILSSALLNVDLSGCVKRSCPLCGHFCCSCRYHSVHPSHVIPSYFIFCLLDGCTFPFRRKDYLLSVVLRCNGVGCMIRGLLKCHSANRTVNCSSTRRG